MKIDVSIIYVNYYTSELIKDSLGSVFQKTEGVSMEIIIVDNNTERNLEEKFQGHIPEGTPIQYIYLKENIGYGRANNAGAAVATGKYLFLLNPDTLLKNNAIKILSDFLEQEPKAGVCGGNLYSIEGNPIISFRRIFPGLKWDFHELTHHVFSHPFNTQKQFFNFTNKPQKVAFISGADLMIRGELFRECGGFPEYLFMYWDDVALCKRVVDLGFKVYSVPQAQIYHLESRSFDNVKENKTFKIELLEKYRHIYLNKNTGTFERKISNLLYSLFLSTRVHILPQGLKREYYRLRKEFFEKHKNSNN